MSQKACVRSPKKCGADFSVSEVPNCILYSLMFTQMKGISATCFFVTHARKCGADFSVSEVPNCILYSLMFTQMKGISAYRYVFFRDRLAGEISAGLDRNAAELSRAPVFIGSRIYWTHARKCGADFSVSEVPISIVYSLMFAQMNLILYIVSCSRK